MKPRHARAQADDGTNASRKRFEGQRPARGIRYAFVWAIGAPEPKLGGKKIAAAGLGRPANANCFIQP